MSLSVPLAPVPPPPIITDQASEGPRPDKTTAAVLRYLTAMRKQIPRGEDLKAQTDALGDVIGICYKACQSYRSVQGNQLFLWDDWPEYNVQFPEPVDHDDVDEAESALLAADLLPGSKSRRENTNHHRLRDWLQMWVLTRLAPYIDQSDDEIQQAAAGGQFRYLARRCVLALRQKVARRYPKDGQFNRVCVSLDRSYAAPDVQNGEDTSLVANVTGPDLNIDCDPHDLLWMVTDPIHGYRHEFDRLGVTEVLTEVLRGLLLETGADTKNVARLSGVGERQARNQINRCCEILAANRDRPAVQELYELLEKRERRAALPEESRDSKFRRRVLSEAAKDKWDGISVKAAEPKPEPGDFKLVGDELGRIALPGPTRRASMVDRADNDRESYFDDGVEVDRYGDEVGMA